MNILLMDTSGKSCCVALATEDRIIAEEYLDIGLTHSETLMRLVEDIYKKTGISRKDTDLIGITNGPGSFTGLRIGMSTAKALAQSMDVKIAEISTLDAIRENVAFTDDIVISAVDALHERVYASSYNGLEIGKGIYELSFILNKAQGRKVIFVGDGAERYRDIICNSSPSFRVAGPFDMYPRANGMLKCALMSVTEGKLTDAYTAKLDYFMASQAERNLHE